MGKRKAKPELNERARNILKVLIQEYVRTGEPVGSRRLAKIYREGVSAATIRNVVADLEEMGFLEQPHTSAGRVPTGLGYRFYVDSLLNTRGLSCNEADEIRLSLEQEPDPDVLMDKTSRILSVLSRNLGFVLAPPFSSAVMRHIEFVKMSPHRILVILVTRSGLVQHRLIQVTDGLSQSELDEAGNYLTTHFEGETLLGIRDRLLRLMSEERALYDRLLKNVVLLGSLGLIRPDVTEEEGSGLYLGGAAHLVQRQELANTNRARVVFQALEEKSRLLRIINECLKSDQSGPSVKIGLENHIPGMRDWALVSCPYHCDHQVMGSVGIIGPARMEYEKAISLVDYVAKLFGKILSIN